MNKLCIITTIVLFFVITLSCSSGEKLNISAQDYYKNFQNEIQKHEWTSFDVTTTKHDTDNKTIWKYFCHVIACNHPNSSPFIAILIPNNYNILIDSNTTTYICDKYAEIAYFHKDSCINNIYNLFYVLVYETIENYVEFCNIYSPIIENFSNAYISDNSKSLKNKKGFYRIKGVDSQKICTPTECYLVETPLLYFFNTSTGILDSISEESTSVYKKSEHISNISHLNCQNIIDSVFDINADKYINYSKQHNDKRGIFSRGSIINTEMTENVLNYPLINITTGDTTSLNNFKDWKILCLWNNFDWSKDYAKELEKLPINDILYVMPHSDNLTYLKPWADYLNIPTRTFYAKKISRVLSTNYQLYLISPKNEVIHKEKYLTSDYSDLLKAKADYEKQHNLKP